MKQLIILVFFIPNLVLAEGMVFDCLVQYDKAFHIQSGQSAKALELINTDPYNESYLYNPEDEVLIDSKDRPYMCEKNNWILTCKLRMFDPRKKHTETDTIEIGRKDLNYRMYRVTRKTANGIVEKNFRYTGKCKVIEENQF